jgi:dTDP-4-dehydrorhamnose reductase
MEEPVKGVVIGSRGMLAGDLIPRMKGAGIETVGFDLPEHDITQLRETFLSLEAEHPDIVINCAAYTAVDRAESEHEAAFRVNRDGAAYLADACGRLRVPLVHISTDFVFSGDSVKPYREDDRAVPLNVYGRSKREGEEAIRARLTGHIIVRTAWLFGVHGDNFVKTILKLAHEREELRVVDDQTGCPTWTGDLAGALVSMLLFLGERPGATPWGTYHFCGAGWTTWYKFACAIVDEARRYERLSVRAITPVTSDQYPVPAKRPSWSVLDTGKIARVFGIKPLPWIEGMKAMLRELYGL